MQLEQLHVIIMHCILVADPTLQDRDEESPSFYMPLWTECQEASMPYIHQGINYNDFNI
jgi:hypothetical protein